MDFGVIFIDLNFEEIIVPLVQPQEIFKNKVGDENSKMMWDFQDKSGRNVCLIPEVTGVIQNEWNTNWSKKLDQKNLFYFSKCFRYERPQKGRYREFYQFGVECLGKSNINVEELMKNLLRKYERQIVINYENSVTRGLGYYTEKGFEAKVENLGAQKQIAGGGTYAEGSGFAIGIDRLVLALMEN